MADAPFPITSPPAQPGQPWDAAAPDGSVGGWMKLPGGAVGADGQFTGDDFPDSGPFRQC
jgi:hypothetical protein